jgi:hypothetical protein
VDDGYKTYPDQRVRRGSWKLSAEGHFQVPRGEEGYLEGDARFTKSA